MEQIFFVRNDYLYEVNNYLQQGGKVKMIIPVAENVSEGGDSSCTARGDLCAYVVVEF